MNVTDDGAGGTYYSLPSSHHQVHTPKQGNCFSNALIFLLVLISLAWTFQQIVNKHVHETPPEVQQYTPTNMSDGKT